MPSQREGDRASSLRDGRELARAYYKRKDLGKLIEWRMYHAKPARRDGRGAPGRRPRTGEGSGGGD